MSTLTSLALFVTGLTLFMTAPSILSGTKWFDRVFQAYVGLAVKSINRGVLLDEGNGPFSLRSTSVNKWGVQEFEYNDKKRYKDDPAGLTLSAYGSYIGVTTMGTLSILSARLAEVAELVHEKASNDELEEVVSEKEREEVAKRDIKRTKKREIKQNTKVKLPKKRRAVDLGVLPSLFRRSTTDDAPNVTEDFVKQSQSYWSEHDMWETAQHALMALIGMGIVWFMNDQAGGGGGGLVGDIALPAFLSFPL